MTRIVTINPATGAQVGEYIFVRESAADYPGVSQVDVNIGDVHALSTTRMVVIERDKFAGDAALLKKAYIADFSQATNVMGVSDINGVTLESMTPAQLVAAGITPMTKELLVDLLEAVPTLELEKVEGVTFVDSRRMVICMDNDYGVEGAAIPPTCNEIKFRNPVQ